MYYVPKHFAAYEVVPEHVYAQRGDKSFQLIDDRLLVMADYLRDTFGSITINDYKWGGNNQWRGLRTADSPYYSPYSQHSFGRALDLIFKDITAEEVRRWLKGNAEVWSAATGITSVTCEEEVSWLHIDLRNNSEGYNSFFV